MTTKSRSSELLHDAHNFNINIDTRELFLHSHIGEEDESGVDYRMAVNFIKNLHFLVSINNKKNILVHMITGGGDWNYGIAIYDAIRSCPCPVSMIAHALASSMSSIILQAADIRILMPHTEFMVHYGGISLEDNMSPAKSTFQQIESQRKEMIAIYLSQCQQSQKFKGKTPQYIKNYFTKKLNEKQDWYLSPEEAIEFNLADGILGQGEYEDIYTIRSMFSD